MLFQHNKGRFRGFYPVKNLRRQHITPFLAIFLFNKMVALLRTIKNILKLPNRNERDKNNPHEIAESKLQQFHEVFGCANSDQLPEPHGLPKLNEGLFHLK